MRLVRIPTFSCYSVTRVQFLRERESISTRWSCATRQAENSFPVVTPRAINSGFVGRREPGYRTAQRSKTDVEEGHWLTEGEPTRIDHLCFPRSNSTTFTAFVTMLRKSHKEIPEKDRMYRSGCTHHNEGQMRSTAGSWTNQPAIDGSNCLSLSLTVSGIQSSRRECTSNYGIRGIDRQRAAANSLFNYLLA